MAKIWNMAVNKLKIKWLFIELKQEWTFFWRKTIMPLTSNTIYFLIMILKDYNIKNGIILIRYKCTKLYINCFNGKFFWKIAVFIITNVRFLNKVHCSIFVSWLVVDRLTMLWIWSGVQPSKPCRSHTNLYTYRFPAVFRMMFLS